MNIKKNIAILFAVLSMVFGCNRLPPEVDVSMSLHSSEDIDSFQVICFVSDMSGKQIDQKMFKIPRNPNDFWTKYDFKVPSRRQIGLEATGINSGSRSYRDSKKITTDKASKMSVYLSLAEEMILAEQNYGATVKVSGTVLCPEYEGKIKICVTTMEAVNKIKYKGDSPAPVTQKILQNTGDEISFDFDVPVNLGPAIVCLYRIEMAEPPVCQKINIANSDIADIKLQM